MHGSHERRWSSCECRYASQVSLLVFRVRKAIRRTIQEVTLVTRYLVCRFVLSAALVSIAVSHDPAENKPVIIPGTRDMAAARMGISPAHSARHSRQAHRQISTEDRAPFGTNLVLPVGKLLSG
jgi:hypothetical protein